jgi:hypothetical protein
MAHGVVNISPNFGISCEELLQHVANLRALVSVCRWAWVSNNRQSKPPAESLNLPGRHECEWADESDFPAEKELLRHYGRCLSAVADVDEEGFDDIVLIMSQGNCSTIEVACLPEDGRSPEASTKEAGVLPVLGTVSPESVVCPNDPVLKSFLEKKRLHTIRSLRVETRIDMHRRQIVMNRNALQPFTKEPEQEQAVFAPGNPNRNPIAVLNHRIAGDGLPKQSPDFAFNACHCLKGPPCSSTQIVSRRTHAIADTGLDIDLVRPNSGSQIEEGFPGFLPGSGSVPPFHPSDSGTG